MTDEQVRAFNRTLSRIQREGGAGANDPGTREPSYDMMGERKTCEIGLRYNYDLPVMGGEYTLVNHVDTSTGQDWYSLDEPTMKYQNDCYNNHSVQTQDVWRVIDLFRVRGDKWFPNRVTLEFVRKTV